jgi:signal transduction histidine kinase
MTRAQALALLRSTSNSARLEAARSLIGSALPTDLHRLEAARGRESDTWVQRALDRAIAAARQPDTGLIEPTWLPTPEGVDVADVQAVAIQAASRTLLHEIRPLVGRIMTASRAELGDAFEGSRTLRAVERLEAFLQVAKRLHDAAAAPQISQIDLNAMTREVSEGLGEDASERIVFARDEPVIASGDAALLEIALANALRNALEASLLAEQKVVVNCGVSQDTAWIAVLDEGVGLPDGAHLAMTAGATTKNKNKHFGMGLPIAQQAMSSLGGEIDLRRRSPLGTSCVLRWPS